MTEERARRDNKYKNQLSLVPTKIIMAIGEVMTWAASIKKNPYPRDNWRKGLTITSLQDSFERHYFAWKDPQMSDLDDESGLHHLYHVATNLAMMIEQTVTHPELDDRPKNKKRDKNKEAEDAMKATRELNRIIKILGDEL